MGGKLGSSLIFYFVAINDDRKSDIHHACRNLYSSGAQVPQRVIIIQCSKTKLVWHSHRRRNMTVFNIIHVLNLFGNRLFNEAIYCTFVELCMLTNEKARLLFDTNDYC